MSPSCLRLNVVLNSLRMAKLNRRHLLLSGLSMGVTGAAIAQAGQAQTTPRRSTSDKPQPVNESIEAIFGGDRNDTTSQPQTKPPTSIAGRSTVACDRAISSLLIRCSHLGMEQFERGQRDLRYNGSIKVLSSYSPEFDRYSQIATFQVSLDATTTLLTNLSALPTRIVRRIINPTQAFMGFVLTSATHNMIVFRGTSNPKEWVANFQARQSNYGRTGAGQGRVHTGFLRLYEQLTQQVRRAANQFNPALPCYVAGHSLGGALATLAIADLAQTNRALKPQLQLYSYGAPRVGDAAFATFLSAIAPNNYRIINLADMVPMVPPSNLRDQQYNHVGQEWIFLDYAGGDVAASHTTTLYQQAIDRRIETNQMPTFPTAC